MIGRNIIVSLLVLIAALLVVERVEWLLLDWLAFALGSSVSSTFAKVSLVWVVGLGIFAIVGALLAVLVRVPRILWWAFAVGALYAVARFVVYSVHSSALLPRLFAFGALFAAPVVGTIAGALMFRWFWPPPTHPPTMSGRGDR